ncbi:SRPBCC domain-containing protein [Nordella sp. HKS 07]|uniref:SRPBCC family protein n=1 Tax=Nordella sp. HKS 07 TaxID=2712222 RepID=UPI00210F6287|nr:SRPBCC domain-containing protein [Nordella sp. HKS 07]
MLRLPGSLLLSPKRRDWPKSGQRHCRSKRSSVLSEFRFGDEEPTLMKVIELENAKRLVWHCVDSEPEWVGTDVSFDLKEENGKTSVLLKHMNWREVTEYFRSCNYNWAMFLYSLKAYCEAGEGLPYQKRTF